MATGGIIGLIGTGVSFFTHYKQKQQDHEFEMEKMRLDLEVAKAEGESAERKADIVAEGRAMEASYKAAATRWSTGDHFMLAWIDVVRGLMRPGLTAISYLLAATLISYGWSTISPTEKVALIYRVINMAEAMGLWWFGTRHLRK